MSQGIKSAQSPDDIVKIARVHNASQIAELDAKLVNSLPKTIEESMTASKKQRKHHESGTMSSTQKTEYVKIMLERGPKQAKKYLKTRTNLSPEMRATVHSNAVEKANEICIQFKDEYVASINQMQNETGAVAAITKRKSQLAAQRKDSLKILQQQVKQANSKSLSSAKLLSYGKMTSKSSLSLASKSVGRKF